MYPDGGVSSRMRRNASATAGSRAAKLRGEPATDRALDDRSQPLTRDHRHASVPHVERAELRRRVGEDESIDALGRARPKPLADDAAERDAGEIDAFDIEDIKERKEVRGEQLDRDAHRTHGRLAVPANVVCENAHAGKRALGSRDLAIPQRGARAQRMAEREHAPIRAPCNS